MVDPRAEGPCQETSGFLFPHECPRRAMQTCQRCHKAVCNRHTHFDGEEALCTSCAKKLRVRRGRPARSRSHGYGTVHEDPYFYGGTCYRGYGTYAAGYWGHRHYASSYRDDEHATGGHDPDDFTEADGAATNGLSPEVEGDRFEEDMGAS